MALRQILTEPNSILRQKSSAVEKVDVEEDEDQSIEFRISPFENGLYFSLGVLSTGSKYQKVTFNMKRDPISSK